jgi:ribonuclease-3
MDAKSHLQELVQSRDGFTPHYKVISEVGPDHDKVFTVGVYVDGRIRGKGVGPSKQVAQQQAAEKAVAEYENSEPIDNRDANL